MSAIPSSDEETVVVPTKTFFEGWKELDGSEQQQVMMRIRTLVAQPNPEHYIHDSPEGYEAPQIIRSDDAYRIYCRLMRGISAGNRRYNVLYAFYIDDHTYDPRELSRYDDAAVTRMEEATSLSTIDDVEAYLEEHDVMTLVDIDRILDR